MDPGVHQALLAEFHCLTHWATTAYSKHLVDAERVSTLLRDRDLNRIRAYRLDVGEAIQEELANMWQARSSADTRVDRRPL